MFFIAIRLVVKLTVPAKFPPLAFILLSATVMLALFGTEKSVICVCVMVMLALFGFRLLSVAVVLMLSRLL